MMGGDMCGCWHHKITPLVIMAIGLVFLLGALDVITADIVNTVWPILLMVVGFSKLTGSGCGCCKLMKK